LGDHSKHHQHLPANLDAIVTRGEAVVASAVTTKHLN